MIDRDTLLASVLEGPLENEPWSSFLERLREPTGADHATLIFRLPGRPLSDALHVYSGTAPRAAVQDVYSRYFNGAPQLGEFEMEEGKVYSFEDFYPPRDDCHQPFFQQVLMPNRIQSACMIRVTDPTGVNAWLSLARENAKLSDHVVEILGSLVIALRASLRFYIELERERFDAKVASDFMRSLRFGWISLDTEGAIIDCDKGGAMLLRQSNVLFRNSAGVMSTRSRELSQELASTIQRIVKDPAARPTAFVLSRDPWLDMLLVRSTKTKLAAKVAPTVIAYVHGDSWASAERCSQLVDLFGLSSNEARLALALSHGRTLTEAAGDLGLSVETVRSYSKIVYSKTGAKGQADLVRIVMRSILAFSPDD